MFMHAGPCKNYLTKAASCDTMAQYVTILETAKETNNMAIRSEAKLEIIKFINTVPMEGTYTIFVKGTEEQAKRFVHRMRVELSRIRDLFRQRYPTRRMRNFKMLLVEITPQDGGCFVKLKKTEEFSSEIDDEVEEVLQNLEVN